MRIKEIEPVGSFIHHTELKKGFWCDYSRLWTESLHKSPFQSPNFLQNLIKHHEKGEIVIFQFYNEEELRGCAFFQKRNRIYQFLSDVRTDHNYFVIHEDCDEDEILQFFDRFFGEVKKLRWNLTLNYQPTHSGYWQLLKKALDKQPFYKDCLPYSVYPVMTSESPEALANRLTKSKSTKYYKNKLRKEHGVKLEVFRDDEDLDTWIDSFATAHIKRWGITNTPSEYNDPARVLLIKDAIRAWITDGILYRFSLKTDGGKRIAFCVGVDEEDSFLYHTQTNDLDFTDYRLGTVMLSYLGEWLGANGFSKLDFGDGDESYKFRYADKEMPLHRVFIAPYSQVGYIVKAKVIKFIRERDGIYKSYVGMVKPLLQDFSFTGLFQLIRELVRAKRKTKVSENNSA